MNVYGNALEREKDGESSDHPGSIEISIKLCAKESNAMHSCKLVDNEESLVVKEDEKSGGRLNMN